MSGDSNEYDDYPIDNKMALFSVIKMFEKELEETKDQLEFYTEKYNNLKEVVSKLKV